MNYYEDECSRNEDFNDTLLHPARSADETTPLIRNREERVLSSYAGSQASDMDEDSSKTLSLIYNPHMLMMLISAALMAVGAHFNKGAMSSLETYILEFLHIDKKQYGILLSLLFIPAVISPLLGKAVDKYGFAKSALVGLTSMLIGQSMFAWACDSGSYPWAAMSRIISGFGSAAVVIIQRASIAYYFQGRWLTLAMSTAVSFANLGNVIAKATEAPVFEHFGKRSGLWFSVVWSLVSLLAGLSFSWLTAILNDPTHPNSPLHPDNPHHPDLVKLEHYDYSSLSNSEPDTETGFERPGSEQHSHNSHKNRALLLPPPPNPPNPPNPHRTSRAHTDPDRAGTSRSMGLLSLRQRDWVAFWVLNVLHAATLSLFHLFTNISTNYLAETYGYSNTKAGYFASLFNSFQLFAPLFGFLVDFAGHQVRMAGACIIVVLLCYSLLFLSGTGNLTGSHLLPVGPILGLSLCATVTLPLLLALVPRTVPSGSFGTAFALLEITSASFAILGNYTVGYIVSSSDADHVMGYFMGLAVICFILTIQLDYLIK